jgi:hypothetical protein
MDEEKILDERDLKTIQNFIDSSIVPPDFGRIPHKIAANLSNLTGDEWKALLLYFAIPGVRSTSMQPNHRRCLQHFVLACSLICRRIITIEDIANSHQPFIEYVQDVEKNYGSSAVTPNMHLHLHLRECLLDYGPVYAFWLFKFESYNGMLGNFPNSNRNIESEIMKLLIEQQQLHTLMLFNDLQQIEKETFQMVKEFRGRNIRTLSEYQFDSEALCAFFQTAEMVNACMCKGSEPIYGKLLQGPSQDLLADPIHRCLMEFYEMAYESDGYMFVDSSGNYCDVQEHDPNGRPVIVTVVDKFRMIRIGGDVYGSELCRSEGNSFVLVKFWEGDKADIFAGKVQFYFTHSLLLQNKTITHTLAYWRPYRKLNDMERY